MSEERNKHGLRPSAYRRIEPDEFEAAMMAEIEKLKVERKTAPFPRNHEIRGEIAGLETERSRHELAQMAKM
jgi:hypothetical protein